MAQTKPKTVTVKTADGLAFWKRGPEYEGGEVYIDATPVTVTVTPGIAKALREGRLVEVEDTAKK